ncbi:MAG: hypothetical protein AABM32_04690 [Chloroflexota bacterium]
MSNHERDKVEIAVTPSSHDIAVASDVILRQLESGTLNTSLMFDPVAARLAEEPIPDVARTIEGVSEADIRQVRAAATTMTSLAHLQARGAILPLGGSTYHHTSWSVPYITSHSRGGYNIDGPFNFAVAAAYKLPWSSFRAPLIDSPAVFLENLPGSMGPKVKRVLLEAVDAYRASLYFAAAVLIGVASEAAWGQVARTVFRKTKDPDLGTLLNDPYAGAAAIQRSAMALIRGLKLRGIEVAALDAVEQAYRDLRNYAVHKPDEAFQDTRVARPLVGTLLAETVDYFSRLYEINARISSGPATRLPRPRRSAKKPRPLP